MSGKKRANAREPLSRGEAIWAKQKMAAGDSVAAIGRTLGLLRQDVYRSVRRALAKPVAKCRNCGAAILSTERQPCVACRARRARRKPAGR